MAKLSPDLTLRKSRLNEFYGNRAQLQRYHARYLPWLNLDRTSLPALDLGCGSGVFLELVRQQGSEVVGVDCAEEAAVECRANGFDVFKGDALHFLEDRQESFGAVFCSHLIEHFQYPEACRLLKSISASLVTGGRLIVVTPNPASLEVSEYFWLDPTHVRPYPLPLLTSMVEDAGFSVVNSGHQTAPGQPRRTVPRRLFLKLVLGHHYGEVDSFVVAAKA
ncbi:MAG: class I SAM-dependent methyltransferase [Thermoleophilia bacterium]